MKFQIESDVLKECVAQVVALLPRRPLVPVYAFLRLQALPGEIIVSGYNGSVGLVKSIKLGEGDVKEYGDILVLGHDLNDRLSLITADEIKISFAKPTKADSMPAIDITTKSGRLRLGCVVDTSSFPNVPAPKSDDSVLTIKQVDRLLALLRLGATCTLEETDEVMASQRAALTCVALDLLNPADSLVYSSNEVMMLKGSTSIETEGSLGGNTAEILLRTSVVDGVRKVFRGCSSLDIIQTPSIAFFRSDDALMIAHVPNVSYPVGAIRQVVGFEENVSAVVGRTEFLLALQKAELYSDNGYIAVVADSENPMVAINSERGEVGYSSESLSDDVTVQGIESDVFKVRLKPLIDVIKRVEGDFLAIAHKGYRSDVLPWAVRFSQVSEDATIKSGLAFMPLALSNEADATVRSNVTGHLIAIKTPVAA